MNERDKSLFKRLREEKSAANLPEDFLREYFRSFKIGRLYFKFIMDTPLETAGWTAEKLANVLVNAGVIRIITIQESDDMGRFTKGVPRYVEMPGKMPTKAELIRHLTERERK